MSIPSISEISLQKKEEKKLPFIAWGELSDSGVSFILIIPEILQMLAQLSNTDMHSHARIDTHTYMEVT